MGRRVKELPPPLRFAIRKIVSIRSCSTFMVSGPRSWSETSLGGAKLYTKLETAQNDCDFLNDSAAYTTLVESKPVLNWGEKRLQKEMDALPPTYKVEVVTLTVGGEA